MIVYQIELQDTSVPIVAVNRREKVGSIENPGYNMKAMVCAVLIQSLGDATAICGSLNPTPDLHSS